MTAPRLVSSGGWRPSPALTQRSSSLDSFSSADSCPPWGADRHGAVCGHTHSVSRWHRFHSRHRRRLRLCARPLRVCRVVRPLHLSPAHRRVDDCPGDTERHHRCRRDGDVGRAVVGVDRRVTWPRLSDSARVRTYSGRWASLAVAQRISASAIPSRPALASLPWATLILTLAIVAAWTLSQPMEMRAVGLQG